jgi:hypothetical protein
MRAPFHPEYKLHLVRVNMCLSFSVNVSGESGPKIKRRHKISISNLKSILN